MIEPGKKKILFIYLIELLIWPLKIIFSKSSNTNDQVKKILVLELWGIGDVVLASSGLTLLRATYPNADIHVLAKGYAKEILAGHESRAIVREFSFPWTSGLIGKYQIFHWPWKEIITLLRMLSREDFDLAIESRGDIRNHILMFLIGVNRNIGYSFGFGWMLDSKVQLPPKDSHRIEDWRYVCRAANCDSQQISPHLHVSRKEKSDIMSKFALSQDGWIGIHVVASNKSKQWPLERFEKLAREMVVRYPSIPIILIIAPTMRRNDMNLPDSVVVAKDLTLRELIAVIANCRLLVALDGGPMHIGAALNIPLVALFGPTMEKWFGPVGKKHKVLVENVCKYRPCFDYCKFDTPRCIEAIQVEQVVQEIKNLLENKE